MGTTTDGFPIDIVLFAMIAVFLVLRLRSILGRRTGFERAAAPVERRAAAETAGPVIDGRAEPETSRRVPDPSSALGQELARMRAIDRSFDPSHFLGGAEGAFRMIVQAYAAGDRATLRPLLGDDIYGSFDGAIGAREAAGETQQTEIKEIRSATVEDASLRDSNASIVVRFVSDQVSVTLDREGKPVAGAESVTEIVDLWTFERDLSQSGPTWRLVAARSG